MSERTLVASATNLLVRGFQVVPTDRKAPDGLVVNALFAVARAILRGLAFKLPARAIAEKSLRIAGQICIYTNDQITIEELHG